MVTFKPNSLKVIAVKLGGWCGRKMRPWKNLRCGCCILIWLKEDIAETKASEKIVLPKISPIWSQNKQTNKKSPSVCDLKQPYSSTSTAKKRGFKGTINLPPKGTWLPTPRSDVSKGSEDQFPESEGPRSPFQRQNQGPVQELPPPPWSGGFPAPKRISALSWGSDYLKSAVHKLPGQEANRWLLWVVFCLHIGRKIKWFGV